MQEAKVTGRIPTAEEISGFCSQIAMMLNAGVPLYDGLEMLAKGSGEEQEKDDLYGPVSDSVNETGSLYQGLKSDARWPKYLTEMVGIGEETGHLDSVMKSLAAHYAREDKIRSALTHAVTYPLVLGGLLILIILVMLWKVLPLFRQVLSSMGIGAGSMGSRVLNVGSTIGWIVLAVFGVLYIAAVICLILLKTPAREKVIGFFRRRSGVLRRLTKRLSSARIASVLGMTIGSGYPMEEALRLIGLILEDKEAEAKLAAANEKIASGSPMADALAESGLFEPLHGRMLRVASASGQEAETLEYLAGLYEEKAEEDINRMLSVIEPTLVAVLSVVVGAILLSVMLPMVGVLTSMI